MGRRITYSIEELFDTSSDSSVLRENEAEIYYIPSYQRGYKWSSDGEDSQVYKLMTDLFAAYDNSKKQKNEYYLQYITVKGKEANSKNVLELIDGQQRLTTMTILLSVLQVKTGEPSIANNLLSYEVRDVVMDFINHYIYANIEKLFDLEWGDFVCQNNNYDEQDIWYLFSAAKLINKLFEKKFMKNPDDYGNFKAYFLNNVRILLNNINLDVSPVVSAEEIFTNMNNNKIELTNSELLKGLLLIYSAREKTIYYNNRYYNREVLELRNRMGRQWDDVSHWVNKDEINRFFFPRMVSKGESPIESFLLIFALMEKYKQEDGKTNGVFNYFEPLVGKDASCAAKYFKKLILLKFILNEWYNDKDIHNKLGYLFFSKTKSSYSIKSFIEFIIKSKTEIKKELKTKVLEILQAIDIQTIEYGDYGNEIHDILLALNVFENYTPFDFCRYNDPKMKWSLEHIFPQNPDELPEKFGSNDLEMIRSLLNTDLLDDYNAVKEELHSLYIDNEEEAYNSLNQKLKKGSIEQTYTKDERAILYKLMRPNKLNTIGNMALLDIKDNIANSNGMFDFKRLKIVQKISEGSFVPKHTYDVFSKLLSPDMSKDLIAWNEKDINAHISYIEKKIKSIKEKL